MRNYSGHLVGSSHAFGCSALQNDKEAFTVTGALEQHQSDANTQLHRVSKKTVPVLFFE